MKRTILLTCFCLINIYVFGQKYVQRSPEVSKMMSVKDIPVSLNTGIPQISIPLFKMQVGKIEIPISLSYQANGVRIRERSGICGVKWSLNYGGIIASLCPDRRLSSLEDNSLHLNDHSDNKEYKNLVEAKTILDPKYVSEFILQNIGLNVTNYEPYSYQYNLFNYSGKVHFGNLNNNRNSYVLNPYYSGLKFEYIKNGFNVYDKNGLKYIFQDGEVSTTTYVDGNHTQSVSSHYLSRIINNGNTVEYLYENNDINYEKEVIDEYYCCNPFYRELALSKISDVIRTTTYINSICIKEIKGDNGVSVKFFYKNVPNNDDSKQLYKITKLVNGIELKSYELKYIYNGKYNIKEIIIRDSNGNEDGKYEFKYEEGVFKYYKDVYGATIYSEDKYGYYNGVNNKSNIFDSEYEYSGNRDFSEKYARIGILKSIKYPTGLEKKFTYEPNQVKIKDLKDDIEKNIVKSTELVTKTFRISPFDISSSDLSKELILDLTGNKIVKGPKNIIKISIFSMHYAEDKKCNISIRNINDSSDNTIISNSRFNFKSINIYMKPGKYYISVDGNTHDVNITMTWKEYAYKFEKNNLLNGKEFFEVPPFRIKEITSLDNNKTSKISYQYENGDLISIPQFYIEKIINVKPVDSRYKEKYPYFSVLGIFAHSNPVNKTSSASGSFVSYKNVKVITDKGSTYYTFNFKRDKRLDKTLNSPFISYGEFRKLPSLIQYYNKNNTLVCEKFLKYQEIDKNKIYGIKLDTEGKYYNVNLSNLFLSSAEMTIKKKDKAQSYSFEEYYVNEKIFNLLEEKSIVYENNGRYVKLDKFKYTNSYNLLKEHSTLIGNDTNKQVIQYPFDFSDNISKSMVKCNMLDIPIIKENYYNGKIIQSDKIEYFNDINNFGELREYVKSFKLKSGIYIDNIKFLNYNKAGNVRNYISRTDGEFLILWGYKNRFPVALIKNISFNDFINKYISLKEVEELEETIDPYILKSKLIEIKNRLDSKIHMEIYIYNHFGMTGLIDMNGKVKKFKYDSAGRLSDIIDNDGNTEKSFKYNYRTSKKNK